MAVPGRIEPGPGQESARVDACLVGDERVEANEGAFHGVRITSRVVGPFKGGPGTARW